MDKIRLRLTVQLNGNHALTAPDLESFRPLIERGIAAALPGSINLDTVKVTRIGEAKSSTPASE